MEYAFIINAYDKMHDRDRFIGVLVVKNYYHETKFLEFGPTIDFRLYICQLCVR